jgi:hypothetical protein
MRQKITAYTILIGKPEVMIPLGTPRRKREDNIKMDLKEGGWEGVNWTQMAQDKDQRSGQ